MAQILRFVVETPPGSQGVTPVGLAELLDDELGFERGTVGVAPIALTEHDHRWANSMGDNARLGATFVKASGTGARLFQVCTGCGMVRQVSG